MKLHRFLTCRVCVCVCLLNPLNLVWREHQEFRKTKQNQSCIINYIIPLCIAYTVPHFLPQINNQILPIGVILDLLFHKIKFVFFKTEKKSNLQFWGEKKLSPKERGKKNQTFKYLFCLLMIKTTKGLSTYLFTYLWHESYKNILL